MAGMAGNLPTEQGPESVQGSGFVFVPSVIQDFMDPLECGCYTDHVGGRWHHPYCTEHEED